MAAVSEGAAVRERLMRIVEEVTEGEIKPPREQAGEGSIRALGLNSVTMLNLLVAVEDEFGIEWDDDLEEGVLDSFDAMAAHLLAERA
jgi:acyl carrier protein